MHKGPDPLPRCCLPTEPGPAEQPCTAWSHSPEPSSPTAPGPCRPTTRDLGPDGSPESLAAADWAARESLTSDAPLRLLHVGEQQPHDYVPFAGDPLPSRGSRPLHGTATGDRGPAAPAPSLPVG
ncbi:universal stress protein [Streptomyces sp. 900105755]